MSVNTFSIIKPHLPIGYASIIKDRLNNKFSNSYIYKVLNGYRFNNEIIAEAISLAEENKNISKALYQRLDYISDTYTK